MQPALNFSALSRFRITRLHILAVAVALILGLGLAPRVEVRLVQAAPNPAPASYDLSWFTIDGGGGLSTGGNYAIHGTIGQPDAGLQTGGNYALQGGFWGFEIAIASTVYRLYLPIVVQCNGWPVCTN